MFDALWEKHTHVEVTCHSFKMLALASEFEYFLIHTLAPNLQLLVSTVCRLTSSSVGGCFVRLITSRCWQTDLRRQTFPSVSRVSSPLKLEKSSTSFTQKKTQHAVLRNQAFVMLLLSSAPPCQIWAELKVLFSSDVLFLGRVVARGRFYWSVGWNETSD